jgi:hypothetical protein
MDPLLRHYAEEKNPRCVVLMIWAGARPDSTDGGEESDSPLELAARSGDLPTLKAMKPEKYPVMLPKLVRAAGGDLSGAITKYLFSLGAPLNDEADGTSSLLTMALWRVGYWIVSHMPSST